MSTTELHWYGVFCTEVNGVRVLTQSTIVDGDTPPAVRVWREQTLKREPGGDLRLVSEGYWTGSEQRAEGAMHPSFDEALALARTAVPA